MDNDTIYLLIREFEYSVAQKTGFQYSNILTNINSQIICVDMFQRFAAFMAPLVFGRVTISSSSVYSAKVTNYNHFTCFLFI